MHILLLLLSVGGLVKNFNSHQKDALSKIPESRLLLESDAPYLAIQKGDNHPVFVGDIADMIGNILNRTGESLLRTNYANFKQLMETYV